MTPERIEEIKRMMEEEYARPDEPYSGRFIANAPQAVAELLTALEETQQQLTLEHERTDYWGEKELEVRKKLEEAQQRIGKLELYVKSLEFSRDSAQKMTDKISNDKGLELYEAQQTIETLEIAKDYEIELHAKSCTEYQQTIARQREVIEMAQFHCSREQYMSAERVIDEFLEGVKTNG